MLTTDCDLVHPEKNTGLLLAFLLLQLIAAFRLALNARLIRPPSQLQCEFLMEWDRRLVPIICDLALPGDPFLYREQIDVMTDLMIVRPETTSLTRPLNWGEFAEKYRRKDQPIAGIAEIIRERIASIFDERVPWPKRKGMQCRLAVLGLYLIKLDQIGDADSRMSKYEHKFWKIVENWYRVDVLNKKKGKKECWFVFQKGDVANRLAHQEARTRGVNETEPQANRTTNEERRQEPLQTKKSPVHQNGELDGSNVVSKAPPPAMIHLRCDNCSTDLKCGAVFKGKKVKRLRCPKCKAVLNVPPQ